jgi:hypothetical protein
VSENALELMRWQPLQWQIAEAIGGALMRKRNRSQRQPPSQGSGSGIVEESTIAAA